jgi:hypothetical protein
MKTGVLGIEGGERVSRTLFLTGNIELARCP